MKVVHEWLKEYVGPSIPSVGELEDLFTFHAFEVEEVQKVGTHDVIDVKILPDRASYCLSHRGIAREIASITGVPLVHDPLLNEARLPVFDRISVDIEDSHACTRFGVALISGIEVKESPQWLQDRLIALGARPINNIVDATNYVMYALGQPLHAYDAQKFPHTDGTWQFGVRFARQGERVSLIAEGNKEGDRVVDLQGTELLIVDKSSDVAIGLAGVKGGSFASVDSSTSQIIIEAAHFDPIITRKTARRLGIVIDASKRFENNPASGLIPHALREVAALITQIAGGTVEGSIDVDTHPYVPQTITVDPQRVNALLGLNLSLTAITDLITRIGASVKETNGMLEVSSPWERNDLTIEEDYIDEVGRLHGYAHIVSEVPKAVPLTTINAKYFYSEKVRTLLIQRGFSEIITSSFSKKDEVKLRNALASDKSYLRSSLRGHVTSALAKNATLSDLLGAHDTRVFEIGTVFTVHEGQLNEHISLCLGVQSKVQGYTPVDDAKLSDTVAALEAALGVPFLCEKAKGVAECNFSNILKDLPVPQAYDPVVASQEITYRPFSAYPAVSRDIALWVHDGTQPEAVEKIIDSAAGMLRVRTTLVDVFTKEGRTSYAFRLVFQSYEKTLTDDEVNAYMEGVYVAVKEKGWETR